MCPSRLRNTSLGLYCVKERRYFLGYKDMISKKCSIVNSAVLSKKVLYLLWLYTFCVLKKSFVYKTVDKFVDDVWKSVDNYL